MLYIDGFDSYDSVDQMIGRWAAVGGQVGTTYTLIEGRRPDTNGLQVNAINTSYMRSQTFSGTDDVAVGFAIRFNGIGIEGVGGTLQQNIVVALLDVELGTAHYMYVTHALQIQVSTTGGVVTSVNALDVDKWNYIEFLTTNGTTEVRVNGTSEGWIPSVEKTLGSSIISVVFTNNAGNLGYAGVDFTLDDVYIATDTDAAFLGDCRVDRLLLTANATPQDWTASDIDIWLYLNTAGAGTISSDNVGDISKFEFQDLNLSDAQYIVRGVQVATRARKSEAGTRAMMSFLESNGERAETPELYLSTDALMRSVSARLNPDTGQPWLIEELNAAQVGVELTV